MRMKIHLKSNILRNSITLYIYNLLILYFKVLRRIIVSQFKSPTNKLKTLQSFMKHPFISKRPSQIKSLNTNKFIISNYFSFSNKSMENTKLENKEAILKFLDDAKVEVAHVEDHEELKTVNDGVEKLKTITFAKGEYTFLKNLFLKNKAGGFILLSAHNVKFLCLKIFRLLLLLLKILKKF